jgi:ubiquitin carboxyl-terminal hydrolase 36/42
VILQGDKPGPYRLYAVIVHLDMLNSTFFGHYLCFVKDASGRWYEADDSDVKSTTIDKVLGQKAYMLFYAR